MSGGPSEERDRLSWSQLKGVDEACQRFETAWQSSLTAPAPNPRIEDYLAGVTEPEYSQRLRELLRLEREYRARRGDQPAPADYERRFPTHLSVVQDAFTERFDTASYHPRVLGDASAPLEVALNVAEGPDAGAACAFTRPGRFIVGRGHTADFRLRNDSSIGRMHFLVEIDPPACRVSDMASRNGILLNGKRVLSADLSDGDVIVCGETTLRVAVRAGSTGAVGIGGTSSCDSGLKTESADVYATRAPTGSPDSYEIQSPDEWPELDQYEVLGELGRGGMGVVYKAARRSDGTLVALKTIRPGAASSSTAVERFLREASILRNLTHPHIVAFHDLGISGAQFYFVMEFVPGPDFSKLVTENGPGLEVGRAVRLVCQVLDALAYAHAHARRFVHRDVKPRNVLVHTGLDGQEIAKLTDFGLARLYQTSRLGGETLQGGTGGTLGFMAPEQLAGFHQADEPADQYGAAATLYHLLTGKLPYDFPDDPAGRFKLLRERDPEPIGVRRPDLPANLSAVIAKAMLRDPAARFPNVRAFREALLPFTV
jgi:eukaryotic-like serine/threonine-protein kinase